MFRARRAALRLMTAMMAGSKGGARPEAMYNKRILLNQYFISFYDQLFRRSPEWQSGVTQEWNPLAELMGAATPCFGNAY